MVGPPPPSDPGPVTQCGGASPPGLETFNQNESEGGAETPSPALMKAEGPDGQEAEPDGQGVEPDGEGVEPDGQEAEPDGHGVEPAGKGAEPDKIEDQTRKSDR